MLDAGAIAPDFRLEEITGQPRTLDELLSQGKILLAFFKVSCPVCQLTLPYLERFSRVLTGGLQIYGVSQDDAASTQEFSRSFGISLPMLLDREESGYAASNAFQITHVPSMFVIDSSRRIEWASTGFSRPDLEELGHRMTVAFFRTTDKVPNFKGG